MIKPSNSKFFFSNSGVDRVCLDQLRRSLISDISYRIRTASFRYTRCPLLVSTVFSIFQEQSRLTTNGYGGHGTTVVVVTHFRHLDILSRRASVQLSFLLFYVSNVLGCMGPDFISFVITAGWCSEPLLP